MPISNVQLETFAKAINEAARPLVYFDDDADGLTSYLQVKAANKAAIGVRVGRGPELTVDFARKVEERAPDLVLILDKPRVDPEFFSRVKTPTIWLDHHDIQAQEPQKWSVHNLTYLNPALTDRQDRRSVSYWVFRALKGPLWLAAAGTTSDWDDSLLKRFMKAFPKLAPKAVDVEQALYHSGLGEIIQRMNFMLKGSTNQINKNINALTKITGPEELLNRSTPVSRFLDRHYQHVLREYTKQLKEARASKTVDGVLVHVFGEVAISMVTDVANELLHRRKPRLLVIGRRVSGQVKFSLRSHTIDLRGPLREALKDVRGYGGGHKEACGGSVDEDDWKHFLKQLRAAS